MVCSDVLVDGERGHESRRSSRSKLKFKCGLGLSGPALSAYNYFRDYDPAIGRFVESDPIGLFGGINTFAYALAPTMHTDPLGLAEDSITTRIMTLIRNGDTAELNNLLGSGGLNPTQEALVKQGLTRAGDLIRGGLKKSKSYASELADKSYAEICQIAKGSGELAEKASKMKKLIEQADRLAGKGY
jgi:RHS repeat-associated protein